MEKIKIEDKDYSLLKVFFDQSYEQYITATTFYNGKQKEPKENVLDYIDKVLNIPYEKFISYSTSIIHHTILDVEIPQHSNLETGSISLCKNFKDKGFPVCSTTVEIGRIIDDQDKDDGAHSKYGETGIKLAQMYGLAFMRTDNRWDLTYIGKIFPELSIEKCKAYRVRAILRNNLFSTIITDALKHDVNIYDYLLALPGHSTRVRRSSNVYNVLLEIVAECEKSHIKLHKLLRNADTNVTGINYSESFNVGSSNVSFKNCLRTKPFLLLAGISGTGKSQKVQELAFMTCPDGELRDPKSTTPGNYQLVEVKPNWHDSTELLGYYSALSGKYELTDFIRFTYKALQNKDVPFFLCLDEMNLAPVEQYFAEFLSVLETRKKVGDHIETQPLLTKDKFSNCEVQKKVLVKEDGDILEEGKQYKMEFLYSEEETEIINYLKENGLHLPDNLFVIGTVNMDDTTHQFSRKVIDRAFTIEMNGGKMADMFEPAGKTLLEYRNDPVSLEIFKSRFVHAYEVLDDTQFSKYADTIKEKIPALLGDSDGTAKDNNPDSINGILNDTPFRVSYRVQNELVLYLSVLIENAGFPEEIDSLISEAILAILLEKVLPRVQGEKKQLETNGGKSNILKDMKVFVENHFKPEIGENDEIANDSLYMKVIKKLEEMDNKLNGYYTNFF